MSHRPEIITSLQNPRVKSLVALRERKERDALGLCLVEGTREIRMAISNGFDVAGLYICRELAKQIDLDDSTLKSASEVFELGRAAFEKVAMRESRDGVLATIRTRQISWPELWSNLCAVPSSSPRSKKSLILAIQNIEKPGNLGALLRTAEAAGVDALVALDGTLDIWNPNAIRASLGCVFRVPVTQMTSENFLEVCRKHKIHTVAAALTDRSKAHHTVSMTGPTAIVMGSEANGLSSLWLEQADTLAVIPMHGQVDSMNVSVAAGIMVFEALRQRG